MKFYNPTTNQFISSGEISAIYGKVLTMEQLNQMGWFEFIDPLLDTPDLFKFFMQSGLSRKGNTFYQNYIPTPETVQILSSLVDPFV